MKSKLYAPTIQEFYAGITKILKELILQNNSLAPRSSSDVPLAAGASFIGPWEDVSSFNSLIVSVSTDQSATLEAQFSTDQINVDSNLTRFYRIDQIEPPHRFTIGRQYARIVLVNTSAVDQTYLRMQTLKGNKETLNAPSDSILAQDFDAVPVRANDFDDEVALGLRQGYTLWNKWGYNIDIDLAAPEVIASFGGAFVPLTTASAFSIVSTSADDTFGGIGAQTVKLIYVDGDGNNQEVDINLAGLTPVVTAFTGFGINRQSVILSGSNLTNVGTITTTAVTGGSTQAQIPLGTSSTQQAIFFTQTEHTGLLDWLLINVNKIVGGVLPVVSVIGYIYSRDTNTRTEFLRAVIDTSISNGFPIPFDNPFVIPQNSVLYFVAETDKDNTVCSLRFSLKEVRSLTA